MGLLDPLFESIENFLRFFERRAQSASDPDIERQGDKSAFEGLFEGFGPADDLFGTLVEEVEARISQELREEGELRPENIEDLVNTVEGASVAVLAGAGIAGSAIETASLGQIDQHQEYITQATAALSVDDATGMELESRIKEGVMPALNAKVNSKHRSKFADLQDAIELGLRTKDRDDSYLQLTGGSETYRDLVGPDDLESINNPLEEYGIRDDQLPILEQVAIKEIEFEELLETPSELGLVVEEDILEAELDRAGYAEPTKEFLQKTANAIRRTARTYQELLVSEELVGQLDTLAEAGVVSPEQAVGEIPDEVEADTDAFRERFELLRDLPAGSPSGTDFENAFASGYLSLSELRDRLDQTEYPPDQFEPVLQKVVLDELDGDLQEAVGLGLLSEAKYSDFAEFAGLDDETVALLLQGQSFGDITTARLQESTAPSERAVGTIVGIGESRARALDGVGIETVQDLAGADVETVAEAAQVSPETAEQFIQQARRRVQ